MGFGSDWLEESYLRWNLCAARRQIRLVLCILAIGALSRTIAHAPDILALRTATISLSALILHLLILAKPDRVRIGQIGTVIILIFDCLLSLPGHDSLLPSTIAIFCIYSLLSLSFHSILAITIILSLIQICTFILFIQPLRSNELLACLLIHIWTHFISVYLHITYDRISRSSFLSGRNSVEAENNAEQENIRLDRLLSSFLPPHLIPPFRLSVPQFAARLFTEQYPQATVCYARLIGFESVLSQCTSLDAARVLKELDSRIDRLASDYGCIRVPSDGIIVISGVPNTLDDHAERVCRFALNLESLIKSFHESTTSDVSMCAGIDSGIISGGIIGSSKWHYDIVGIPVDNAILLQSSAASHGVFVTLSTRRLLPSSITVSTESDCWRISSDVVGNHQFPINKRFSLMTIPQSINRLLQTISTIDPSTKTVSVLTKKKKTRRLQEIIDDIKPDKTSFMNIFSLQFKNARTEQDYHKEMDHWFIPALAISIFFLVVYGIYHMLVMPRLITSLVLIIISLIIIFFLLLMIYINFFHTFSQFITRTLAGHSITIILILTILFVCGIVNTFSCPRSTSDDFCQSIHFSAFSLSLWILTSAVYLRFSSFLLLLILFFSIFIYIIQIFLVHPPIGPKQFGVEFDLLSGLISLSLLVFFHSRRGEKMIRLDFLSVVKGVEESSRKDDLIMLNSQVLLNLVPSHIAPWIITRSTDLWHHAHHSVGVAYLAVSGFDIHGEHGLNALNYIFSVFDQMLSNYRGIEKVKNANRFYIVAVGILPDTTHNVNETPWTIGELLFSLSQYLLHITQFAAEKQFHVQIGLDCGSSISLVSDPIHPHYELWGDTVERSRILMQSANQGRILVSEEIYLALRPRNLIFSRNSIKIMNNLNAYIIYCGNEYLSPPPSPTSSIEYVNDNNNILQMLNDNQNTEMPSSMASSFSSELQSIDGGETDSDIEWMTPETALMHPNQQSNSFISYSSNKYRNTNYDPYREPQKLNRQGIEGYKDEKNEYSDWSEHESRAASRNRNNKRTWSSKNSLRRSLQWLRKGGSVSIDSLAEPADRLEAAASRVDRMLQELNQYGDFADVKPLEYHPFPTHFGSGKSLNRAMSSACRTEYDNAESEDILSDTESYAKRSTRFREKRFRKRRDGTDGDTESQCSSRAESINLNPIRWKSNHSIGYENEYEIQSDNEGLAITEMQALSRDIRNNFGDFQLSTFDDIDQD